MPDETEKVFPQIIQPESEEEKPGSARQSDMPGTVSQIPRSFLEELRYQQHELEKHKIDAVLEEWRNQQEADRKLRKNFGHWLVCILAFQLLAFTTVFILVSIGIAKVDSVALPIWIGSLVLEVIGLVIAIVRGLFTNTTKEFFGMVQRVLSTTNADK